MYMKRLLTEIKEFLLDNNIFTRAVLDKKVTEEDFNKINRDVYNEDVEDAVLLKKGEYEKEN